MSTRIISTPIVGSPLARMAIDGTADPDWFVKRPASPAEWKERADLVRQSLIMPDWLSALGPAFGATGKAAERLQSAARSGIAVTAGQQPGLFGGPLYTWWKALSAVALADRLEEQTGLPAVPIFWAATDDSDFAESASTVVTGAEGAERIEMSAHGPVGAALSDMPLGDVSRELARLAAAAGSAPNPGILEVVRRAYTPEHTIGSAYVELLRAVLEPLGVAVLDASHPAVREAAFPLLRRAVSSAEQIEGALTERARALKAAGHSAQVKLVKGRTLVFAGVSGKRDRIRMREIESALEHGKPGTFGPNVLLRPIVERSILPTVGYIGGPAEIAYFAQVTAVARALEVPPPLVLPRWSGLVVEPRIERILERYSLAVDDFRDPHAVESRIAKESLPPGLVARIRQLEQSVDQSVEELTRAEGADLVAPSVLEGLRRGVLHRIERLERRFAASVKRKGNEALRDAAIARGALFPLGTPQERALNIVPLLARHGDELFASVMREARAHAARLA
ncbi:MAG: bacillithiol biosynthesis cysteine-adding enzyme BshC [Gemmatimonadaceae bacterium]|nr:bacillithiol biosynthesis cysteine-adding enzyme BshC [Gemmatimonadaceae bacterium]